MGLNWTNKQDLVDTILAADVNALAAAIIALENASVKVHASTHATGGGDVLTPAQIGAAAAEHTHDYGAKSQAKTASLTVAGWDSSALTQTVSVAGVTASNNIIVAPAPASHEAWGAAGIRATAQASGTVTFTCATVPTEAITAQILIVG